MTVAVVLVGATVGILFTIAAFAQYLGLIPWPPRVHKYVLNRENLFKVIGDMCHRAHKEVLVLPSNLSTDGLWVLEELLNGCGRRHGYIPYLIAYLPNDQEHSIREDGIIAYVSSQPTQAYVIIDGKHLLMFSPKRDSDLFDLTVFEHHRKQARAYAAGFCESWNALRPRDEVRQERPVQNTVGVLVGYHSESQPGKAPEPLRPAYS